MLDPLTLDQLRVLVAIAEAGSFSAAARRLGRVQSAVSQAVQALENTLRLALFDRGAKIPKLTEAGRAVVEDARRVIEGAEGLRARADAIAGGLEPELTIAADYLLPRGPGTRVLRALSVTFPNLPVTLLMQGAGAVEGHLRDGTAGLAIFPFEAARWAADLDAEFLVDIRMLPVAAAAHPLARHGGELSREDLAPHVQLVPTDGGSEGRWSRGAADRRVWRFADLSTRLAFLLEGFGWCYMPLDLVRPHLADGRLKRLRVRQEGGGSAIALHVVHRRGRRPGIAARWAAARLREALAEAAAEPDAGGG